MSVDRRDFVAFSASLWLLLGLGLLVPRLWSAGQAGEPPPRKPAEGTAPGHPDAHHAGPLVIVRGGTYRGRWEGPDAHTPAVTIRTAEPVVLEHSELSGRFHLIQTDTPHAKLTVRHCRGRGLNPDVAGRSPGRFLNAEYFDDIRVEHNDLEGTAGIYLLNYRGNPSAGATVKIVGNRVRDIDGRKSDGHGGFLGFNKRVRKADGLAEEGFKIAQFLQMDKVRHVPGMEVAWNEVINEPGRSRVEDNIDIYLSGGTAGSPLLIHDNYIQGAYTIKPWQADSGDATWDYGWGYSGGGILLGDGAATTAGEASAFVTASDNQVVATTNHGISIVAGHDIEFHDNRIVASGLLPDGRVIVAQNVGAMIWDLYHAKGSGAFARVRGQRNRIGWVKGHDRNDCWTPDATSWTANVSLPGSITRATEAAEFARWREKLAAARRSVGAEGAR